MASLFHAAKRGLPRPVGDWLRVRRRDVVRLGTGVDIQEAARQMLSVRQEVLGDMERRTLDLLARQDAVLASYERRVAALVNRVLDLEEQLPGPGTSPLDAVLRPHSGRSPVLGAQARTAYEPDPAERKLTEDRVGRHVESLRHQTPIIDVGDGVALAALQAAGVEATGVGLDPGTAAAFRESGLDAHAGDAMVELVRRPEASAGAVTLVGVVERLELDDLDRLLRIVGRVLRPGGLVVIEARYPTSAGSLAGFWRDPTRIRPWDASTMRWLVGHAGFETIDVLAHPGADADYALTARRP